MDDRYADYQGFTDMITGDKARRTKIITEMEAQNTDADPKGKKKGAKKGKKKKR
eukprot:CAMPEP_0116878178 /NCGR_PEP_ID=MMETSP0463-20121206/9902_1 /TAXON_ID=181622 /ORGANISM="Strombidinopsis sp, Strain SopsisLIS2011" /LENGTH=53 /DNA_ID=CAMNT_0004526087 /DNA_START=1267 /DNA_END=1428 /DNA_ORIENTATION=+